MTPMTECGHAGLSAEPRLAMLVPIVPPLPYCSSEGYLGNEVELACLPASD